MNFPMSKENIIYRDLRQIKRDLQRNLKYTLEALCFISELEEKGSSNKICRRLLTRLRRLEYELNHYWNL